MYNYGKERDMFKELANDILDRETLDYRQKMILMQALVNSQMMMIQEQTKAKENGNV